VIKVFLGGFLMKQLFCKTYFTKCLATFITVTAIFTGIPVFCDEPAKAGQQAAPGEDLLATIRHMEALLLRPCDKVETIMNDLIRYGRGYQIIEEERAGIYSEWSKAFMKYVSDFIVVTDEKGVNVPGRFIKEFLDLKKMAEDGGVLAEGSKPDVALIQLAHSKSRDKYFYFEDPDSTAAKKKLELRHKLEEEYEKLTDKWNKARDEFYKQFEDKGVMKNYADALDQKTKEGKEFERKYSDNRAELTTLAVSDNFEHCLGKIKPLAYSTRGADDIFAALYAKGEDGTPDGLPGMGYKFVAQKDYNPITKPDIGNFPLALHLKFNGSDYYKLEKDILEIKIKAEEEETRVLGMGLGKYGQFCFQVTYKTTEALAAPVKLVQYVATHPIDSTVKAFNFVVGLPKMIGDIKPFELDKKAGAFLWGSTEKLFVAVGEIAKDLTPITWDRFDPKPGETMDQEIERLKAKLDSTKKIKEGMEVGSSIVSVVVQALIDKGITKGLGKVDSVVDAFKQESRLKNLVNKVDALQDEKSLLKGNMPDIAPDRKVLQDLVEEQSKNAKEFNRFITGEKPIEQGAKLADNAGKKIGAVDGAGQAVQLRAGEQLGKPGGFNTAFVDADNSKLVIRKTNNPMSKDALEAADAHDKFGRNVLEKEVGSPAIRVAKLEGEYYEKVGDGIVRYQKVERVEATAADQIASQTGGKMTKGQELALEQAHRDLNNSGYVWMDNTPKNYSFEKLPGGDDRWKIVVIDPDGIYPIKGKNPLAAKAFQEAVNNTPKAIAEAGGADTNMEKLFKFSEKYEEAAKKFNINPDPNNAIDWDALKKSNPKMVKDGDVSELHWAPDSKRLDVPENIAKLPDDKLIGEFDKYNYDQLASNKDYQALIEKQNALNKKADEIAAKIEPQVQQAEKAMEQGPKAPPEPDKPSGIDKDVADKMNFLSQVTASTINAENCTLLRKALLGGSKENWLADAVKNCIIQGF
jgi:hypothetical protein